ncbi:MAG: hypothetical protein JJU20_13895 [Opitutales bacterium]|nr:hypothetical protein [Opitutales bacterium]
MKYFLYTIILTLFANFAQAQTGYYNYVQVSEALRVAGSSAQGIYGRAGAGVPSPLNNTSNQSLFLWNAPRGSFYSGYYLTTDITTDLNTRMQSVGLGYRAVPKSNFATAIGFNARAFTYAIAMGSNAEATGNHSVAIGSNSKAEALYAFAAGRNARASYRSSTALGEATLADANFAFAAGENSWAKGVGSVALGLSSEAFGAASFASGDYTRAAGEVSFAHGRGIEALHYGTFAVGLFNEPHSSIGANHSTRPLFVVGNGTSEFHLSNALEVRANGEVHIQKIPPKGGISMGNFQ